MVSIVFPPTPCLVGEVVVEAPNKMCCGGVYGALEIGRALASYSFMLRLESPLYSSLCNHEYIVKCCVNFEHSSWLFCIIEIDR